MTVELLPGGDGASPQHLGTAIVWNDGTGTEAIGNYVGTLSKWGRPNVLWSAAHVRSFDRKNRGVWDLLLMVLAGALEGRRNPGAIVKRLSASEVRAAAPQRARQQELGATQTVSEGTER